MVDTSKELDIFSIIAYYFIVLADNEIALLYSPDAVRSFKDSIYSFQHS